MLKKENKKKKTETKKKEKTNGRKESSVARAPRFISHVKREKEKNVSGFFSNVRRSIITKEREIILLHGVREKKEKITARHLTLFS